VSRGTKKATLIREDAQDKFKLDELITTTGFIKSSFLPVLAEGFVRFTSLGGTGSTVTFRAKINGSPFTVLDTLGGGFNYSCGCVYL